MSLSKKNIFFRNNYKHFNVMRWAALLNGQEMAKLESKFIHHHLSRLSSYYFYWKSRIFFLYILTKKIHRFLIHDLTHSTFYTTLCFLCKIDWRNSSYIITQHQKPNNWWFMSPKGQNHDEERKYKNWKEKRALLKNQADISYLLVQFNCAALLLAIM